LAENYEIFKSMSAHSKIDSLVPVDFSRQELSVAAWALLSQQKL
jgi:hypothetical protein